MDIRTSGRHAVLVEERSARSRARSYLHGHSGISRASSRHSGVKERLPESGADLGLVAKWLVPQSDEISGRSPTRFWTSIALIGGGGALATLSTVELGDDETGPDDGEDGDDSDDGEDSDGWGNKAMLGGGIAAAALGTVLLVTGRKKSGPEVSIRPGGVAVRQTVRF